MIFLIASPWPAGSIKAIIASYRRWMDGGKRLPLGGHPVLPVLEPYS